MVSCKITSVERGEMTKETDVEESRKWVAGAWDGDMELRQMSNSNIGKIEQKAPLCTRDEGCY